MDKILNPKFEQAPEPGKFAQILESSDVMEDFYELVKEEMQDMMSVLPDYTEQTTDHGKARILEVVLSSYYENVHALIAELNSVSSSGDDAEQESSLVGVLTSPSKDLPIAASAHGVYSLAKLLASIKDNTPEQELKDSIAELMQSYLRKRIATEEGYEQPQDVSTDEITEAINEFYEVVFTNLELDN